MHYTVIVPETESMYKTVDLEDGSIQSGGIIHIQQYFDPKELASKIKDGVLLYLEGDGGLLLMSNKSYNNVLGKGDTYSITAHSKFYIRTSEIVYDRCSICSNRLKCRVDPNTRATYPSRCNFLIADEKSPIDMDSVKGLINEAALKMRNPVALKSGVKMSSFEIRDALRSRHNSEYEGISGRCEKCTHFEGTIAWCKNRRKSSNYDVINCKCYTNKTEVTSRSEQCASCINSSGRGCLFYKKLPKDICKRYTDKCMLIKQYQDRIQNDELRFYAHINVVTDVLPVLLLSGTKVSKRVIGNLNIYGAARIAEEIRKKAASRYGYTFTTLNETTLEYDSVTIDFSTILDLVSKINPSDYLQQYTDIEKVTLYKLIYDTVHSKWTGYSNLVIAPKKDHYEVQFQLADQIKTVKIYNFNEAYNIKNLVK